MTTANDSQEKIRFELKDGLARILLDRPQALNALTLDEVRAMDQALRAWAGDDAVRCVFVEGAGEKAFCAGGDIRFLWQASRANDPQTLRTFFGEEYRLNRLIKTYAKPHVAWLDGIAMGGGVGISIHGSHRVATERTVFAMPETGIGMIPDVGGSYFLPRLPGKAGRYLALTGARLKAADCYALGIATHVIPSVRRDEVIGALGEQRHHAISADQSQSAVTCILDMFHEDPGVAPIEQHRAEIDRLFDKPSVDAILDVLHADGGEWAAKQARIIEGASPFAVKATFRQLQLGSLLEFDRCMQIEWRASQRIAMSADFAEGVRAVVVDKDNTPKWAHSSLSEVDDTAVDALFAPLDGPDLVMG